MSKSGRTPGSGRKKGTLNRDTAELHEMAKRLKVSPFEILLLLAKGDWKDLGYQISADLSFMIDPAIRCKAAAEACKYLHPQRRALELETKEPLRVVVEDYTGKPNGN